jgi:hypothetical protein
VRKNSVAVPLAHLGTDLAVPLAHRGTDLTDDVDATGGGFRTLYPWDSFIF